jgi:hypothetical protein
MAGRPALDVFSQSYKNVSSLRQTFAEASGSNKENVDKFLEMFEKVKRNTNVPQTVYPLQTKGDCQLSREKQ